MADVTAPERRPLLPSEHDPAVHSSTPPTHSSRLATTRRATKAFLTSKLGHYSILALVSLDITGIFADLLLTSLACERRIPGRAAAEAGEALGIVSLVFSCLFVVELIASIWAFGLRYFASWFHCLDATVIIVGFIIDVLLHGVLEEIGSIVVVLRLWRVFKIIEELGAGASEQMEPLSHRIEDLEKQNGDLRHELEELRKNGIRTEI